MEHREEQTVLITGATDGLGKEVARNLAGKRAGVLVHGRDAGRTEDAVREIAEETNNHSLRYYLADLSSLEEVRQLAEQVRSEHERLDVLINNAGVIMGARRESEDSIELTFAINYLSHFLLNRLLLPVLKESAPARIVNVASAGQSPIDFDDVMLKRGYESMRAYGQSKLAMIVDTFELAEELEGSGITVNALHPATLMDTKMVRKTFGSSMSSVEEGVEATVHLATSSELEGVTGRYFDGKKESRADRQAYDKEARKRLRRLSNELVGL